MGSWQLCKQSAACRPRLFTSHPTSSRLPVYSSMSARQAGTFRMSKDKPCMCCHAQLLNCCNARRPRLCTSTQMSSRLPACSSTSAGRACTSQTSRLTSSWGSCWRLSALYRCGQITPCSLHDICQSVACTGRFDDRLDTSCMVSGNICNPCLTVDLLHSRHRQLSYRSASERS